LAKKQNTTLDVDTEELVPMLKQMDAVRDVPKLLQMAGDFLKKCRFAPEKVEVLQREIQNKSDAKAIQLFCWNVLLSGQGLAVNKW